MTRNRLQPNDRSQRAAAKLLGLGKDITRAVQSIQEDLSRIGFPGAEIKPKVTGGGFAQGGPSEGDALEAYRLTAIREDLRDSITDIEDRINALARLVKHILREPMPDADGEALCCDRQRGREGVGEWGSPTCTELPIGGWKLCHACTQRETRWRTKQGLPFRGEHAA